jgi:hypothetical protein
LPPLEPDEEPKLISVEDARRAEPIIRPPDNLAAEELKNSHAEKTHRMQRGIIGLIVGTGPEKAGNVATLAIVASFGLVLIAFFKFDFSTQFELFYKILTTMLGPVGLALGYLFGSKDKQ